LESILGLLISLKIAAQIFIEDVIVNSPPLIGSVEGERVKEEK
jgi:hypothetical protein